MQFELRHTKPKQYYLKVPTGIEKDEELWRSMVETLKKVFEPELTICIDLQHVHELSSLVFNHLHNLAHAANQELSLISYINVDSELDERIALLTTLV